MSLYSLKKKSIRTNQLIVGSFRMPIQAVGVSSLCAKKLHFFEHAAKRFTCQLIAIWTRILVRKVRTAAGGLSRGFQLGARKEQKKPFNTLASCDAWGCEQIPAEIGCPSLGR